MRRPTLGEWPRLSAELIGQIIQQSLHRTHFFQKFTQSVDASFSVRFQARESSDKPILNAFCRVAPSLRFRFLAIFLAGVFLRAADFNSRTSEAVQERRFEFLFAM